ncbi:cellulose binding domain-containing protein [Streptomyces sp. NPDC047028]|uniref:cellulose binding domain-containing protein n=1 Tax=Streptomyces sp. NPDC047028 TaxID=3155793 RepID=UPI0033E99A8E
MFTLFRTRKRARRKVAAVGLVAASGLGLLIANFAGTDSANAAETHSGVATHFDGVAPDGGGCGIPPAQIESTNFVALNVWNTPGKFAADLPRPVPADRADIKGDWDNGLNCGRWVRIKLSAFCSVPNTGAPGAGICKGGTWKPDDVNGATLDAVVTDSCGDGNEWCRSSKDHLDLSTSSLSQFTLDGKQLGDLEKAGKWNNREIDWSFIPAPGYSGDIKIGFARGAKKDYSPVLITHLPNGIHGVEYFDGSAWKQGNMTGDNGQRYEIQPDSAAGGHYRIRVTDADDKPLNGGREYSFALPDGCAPCSNVYTGVDYTTSGGGTGGAPAAPSAGSSGSGSGSPSAPSPSASASATANGTPPAAAPAPTPQAAGATGCSADMKITKSWPGGFTADVTVHNGGAAVRGWKTSWTWPDGLTVSDSWRTVLSRSGNTVTASNAPYNGALAASASTTFGMTVRGQAPASLPSPSCAPTG